MEKKRTLRIGDAAILAGIAPYTIRYWEREFPGILSPLRGRGGQRVYTFGDIAVLKRIKTMLKQEKYSIAGVRQKLEPATVRARTSRRGSARTGRDGSGYGGGNRIYQTAEAHENAA